MARFGQGSWSGAQLAFTEGIRLEILEPRQDPEDDFLSRFLTHAGPGPHHVTFKVPDIVDAIERLAEMGIQPLKVDLSNQGWKECFLHPRLGLGTVVQLAQASGKWEAEKELPEEPSNVAAAFLGLEVRGDLAVSAQVFGQLLGGTATELDDGGVAYRWDGPPRGTILTRPPGNGRSGVERLVFRLLDPSPGATAAAVPVREEPLGDSAAGLLRVAVTDPWP